MKRFILLWIWQFPQKLLGTILINILEAGKEMFCYEVVYWRFERSRTKISKYISGVSLADVILLPSDNNNGCTIYHEYGHSKQSLYLGWLYLLVVGIYSAVFCNLYNRIAHKDWYPYDRHYWYFKTRWTESWADRLGGVDRDAVLRKTARPANARYPQV
jgi:hypothetical protein